MTDETSIPDLYRIADQIPDLIEAWHPDPDAEAPTVPEPERDDWLRRRLLGIRFRNDEIAGERDRYAHEIHLLQAEIDALVARRDSIIDQLARDRDHLVRQVTALHSSIIESEQRRHRARAEQAAADGDNPPKPRVSTSIKLPHGDLRSQAGGNIRVIVDDDREQDVIDWLLANGHADVVTIHPPQPERREIDGRKIPKLVKRDDLGDPVGIVNADGEPCPHVRFERRARAHWVVLPDGTSSTEWK